MTVVNFPRHHRYHCPSGCPGCFACTGELFACTRCGGAEECLPTDCPGIRMTANEIEAVQDGVWDYRVKEGGWVRFDGTRIEGIK